MKNRARWLICGLLFIAAATDTWAQEDDSAITAAKATLVSKLKDPESARFRDVVRTVSSETGKTRIICGWVNAKNSFGGYVGFKPFYVAGGMAEIRDDESASMFSNRGLFAGMWAICNPPSGEKFGDVVLDLPKINTPRYCKKLRKTLGDESTTGQNCERNEATALAWLQSHTTASWIAMRCEQKARESHSYWLTKSCVRDQEADVVFRRGPRDKGGEHAQ